MVDLSTFSFTLLPLYQKHIRFTLVTSSLPHHQSTVAPQRTFEVKGAPTYPYRCTSISCSSRFFIACTWLKGCVGKPKGKIMEDHLQKLYDAL
ncbi:hypothetical protein WAI453_009764 [Rhynchosporium graminicola]